MTVTTTAAKAASFPERITPLIGLQFIALAWVVLNQFRFHLGLHAGDRSGLVFKGYLGAELFLVLTGYLACRLYAVRSAAGRFSQVAFLWEWLADVYPVHLAMIAAMGVLGVGAALARLPLPPGTFDPGALAANLLLVHAWGVLPTVSWNFPSWLISAVFFAYLAFPATAWFALKGASRAWIAVLTPVVLFAVLFELAAARGVLFTDMTAQIGALQTIPACLLGAGVYRLGRERDLPSGWGRGLAIASGAWIVAAAQFRLSDLVIVPAFGILVYALAETAKSERPALSWRPLQYLGDISLAMLLVYLPVDIAYFHAVKLMAPHPAGALAWAIWTGVFPVILVASAAVHRLIQRPAHGWLVTRNPFKTRGLPAPASV